MGFGFGLASVATPCYLSEVVLPATGSQFRVERDPVPGVQGWGEVFAQCARLGSEAQFVLHIEAHGVQPGLRQYLIGQTHGAGAGPRRCPDRRRRSVEFQAQRGCFEAVRCRSRELRGGVARVG